MAWTEHLAPLAHLAPLTLPVGLLPHPLPPLEALLEHLASTPVHPTYYPLLRFGVLHAARLAVLWSKLTRARTAGARTTPPSVLQDLVGYLCLCWGGGTLVSLLLSDPPSWLASPTPWLVYVPVYLVLVPTGLAHAAYAALPTLFELAGALADGATRGSALAAIPGLVAHSPLAASAATASPLGLAWPIALLGGLMVWGGALIVQTLGMTHAQWGIHVPLALTGTWLDSMDAWSAACTPVLQYFLLAHPAVLAPVPIVGRARHTIVSWLPPSSLVDGQITPASAKALGVVFLSTLLLARAVVRLFTLPPPPVRTTDVALFHDSPPSKTSVLKSPRKSPRKAVSRNKANKTT